MASFLLDENIPPQIAEALRIVSYDVYHVSTVSELGTGSTDPKIIEWCRKKQAILVTCDYKMRRIRIHGRLLKQTQVSAAFFRPPSRNTWTSKDLFRIIVRYLDHMEKAFSKKSPLYYKYTSRGAKEITP